MDTDDIREELSPLLDDELEPEQRRILEERIEADPEARAELDALRRVDQLYRSLSPMAAPEGFADDVRARIEAAQRPAALHRRVWRIALPIAAAAALLIVAGIIMLPSSMGGRQAAKREMAASGKPQEALGRYSVICEKTEENKPGMPLSEPAPDEAVAADAVTTVDADRRVAKTNENISCAGGALTSRGEPQAELEPAQPLQRIPQSELDLKSYKVHAGQAYLENEKESAAAPPASPPVAAASPAPSAAELKPESMEAVPQATAKPRDYLYEVQNTVVVGEKASKAAGVGAEDENTRKRMESMSAASEIKDLPQNLGGSSKDDASSIASPRTAGSRLFEWHGGVWRQAGYAGETCTALRRDSSEWKALLASEPELEALLDWPESIIFKHGDSWLCLESQPTAPHE